VTTLADQFSYVIQNHDRAVYRPFVYPAAGGSGATSEFGEIAVLRESSYNGNLLVVAFWRVQPATSPLYDVPLGDESGYVLEGAATIELIHSGERVELNAGDLYSLQKGTLTRWTIHQPFKKFVVVNDGPAARQ
jgi:uncharacterized cupin superfamily protein